MRALREADQGFLSLEVGLPIHSWYATLCALGSLKPVMETAAHAIAETRMMAAARARHGSNVR